MPGSDTEAFKGVSVFLGLMITLGSSGIMNQIMSGFMITYSRALREGDFVKIGDVEGTVTAPRCSVHQAQDGLERRRHGPERPGRLSDDNAITRALETPRAPTS